MKLIPLTQGYFAKVDDHWFDFLNQWKWCISSNGYAVRALLKKDRLEGKQSTIYMHILIHPSPEGMITDHRNTNKLNNQDKNLRTVTYQQNSYNQKPQKNSSSKYKGVRWHIKAKKWEAQIRINTKKKHLGLFNDEIEAAKSYDKAASKYHKEYACINFR